MAEVIPTIRQRRVAENIASGKYNTARELLADSGYSDSMAKVKPAVVLSSIGVKAALAELGMSEANAARVVNEIMHDQNAPASARLTASDMTFKVHGTYAPVKQEIASVTVDLAALEELRALSEDMGKSMRNADAA